jgi:hypothetical protein
MYSSNRFSDNDSILNVRNRSLSVSTSVRTTVRSPSVNCDDEYVCSTVYVYVYIYICVCIYVYVSTYPRIRRFPLLFSLSFSGLLACLSVRSSLSLLLSNLFCMYVRCNTHTRAKIRNQYHAH